MMTDAIDTGPEKDVLAFGDAVLRIWGRNLDLTVLVMEGYREVWMKDYPNADPFRSAASFEINLENARGGAITPAAEKAKLDLVRALLHVWFKVHRHLQNQIFVAVRELAVKCSEDPDQAQFAAMSLLNEARTVEDMFSEKREAQLSEEKRRQKALAKAALEHLRKVLAKEALLTM